MIGVGRVDELSPHPLLSKNCFAISAKLAQLYTHIELNISTDVALTKRSFYFQNGLSIDILYGEFWDANGPARKKKSKVIYIKCQTRR